MTLKTCKTCKQEKPLTKEFFYYTGKYALNKCRKCLCEARLKARNKFNRTFKGKLYLIWANLKQRCYNPKNPVYKYHGAKGIKVCKLWENSFNSFYKWAIEQWKPGLILVRIDKNKDFSPNNCTFVTKREFYKKRKFYRLYKSPITDVEARTRICNLCKIKKKFEEFPTNKSALMQIGYGCKQCRKQYYYKSKA